MTYDEALAKRNEARVQRHNANEELEDYFENITSIQKKTLEKTQNAEYSWGYWDAVTTVMRELGLKEIKI